jgi:hypothetical protein
MGVTLTAAMATGYVKGSRGLVRCLGWVLESSDIGTSMVKVSTCNNLPPKLLWV